MVPLPVPPRIGQFNGSLPPEDQHHSRLPGRLCASLVFFLHLYHLLLDAAEG